LVAWHELVDFDCVVALDRYRVQLLILDLDVGILRILVAPAFVLALNRLSRDLIYKLLPQSVAGLLVYLPERDALARRRRRVQSNRTRNQGKLEVALPIRPSWGHGNTPTQQGTEMNLVTDSRESTDSYCLVFGRLVR
jgi:hypothetical protein